MSQYAGTVADPHGLTRTLGDFPAERDNYGDVKIRSGNNACVFRLTYPNGEKMLKCYVKARPDLTGLYEYISGAGDELLGNLRLLPAEMYVFDNFGGGGWYDVVYGDWVEGPTLHTVLGRACRDRDTVRIGRLSRAFDEVALKLIGREWAHGDLKPENIIVRPDGSLALIDFDALYYPGNGSAPGCELGTPGYQHPLRTATLYDKCLDDFPLALLSVSLKALSIDPGLYRRFHKPDMLILDPAGVVRGASPAYPEVKRVLARAAEFGHYRLALMLRTEIPALEGLHGIFDRIVSGGSTSDGTETVFSSGGYFGFRSRGGDRHTVVEAVFDEACEFRDGAALVVLDGRKRLFSGGRFLLPDIRYEDLKPFSDGLAAFCRSGLWGYADREGKIVIPPRYKAAGCMHHGMAAVCLDGLWGYIDRRGRAVTPFIFERALGFRGGTAMAYKDGIAVRIGATGDIMSCNKC